MTGGQATGPRASTSDARFVGGCLLLLLLLQATHPGGTRGVHWELRLHASGWCCPDWLRRPHGRPLHATRVLRTCRERAQAGVRQPMGMLLPGTQSDGRLAQWYAGWE